MMRHCRRTTGLLATMLAAGAVVLASGLTRAEEKIVGEPAGAAVWAWGSNSDLQLSYPRNLESSDLPLPVVGSFVEDDFFTHVVAVTGGGNHSLALRADGTVWSWGNNVDGQLGRETGEGLPARRPRPVVSPFGVGFLDNIVAIAAGAEHSLALQDDDTVWAWGSNAGGQLSHPATLGSSHTPVAIVAPFGDGFFTEPIVAIATGGSHNLALGDDGIVWAWGRNTFGQLGRESGPGSAPRRPRPVVSPSGDSVLENIVDIAAGAEHSLALQADGTVWAWGSNAGGQLSHPATLGSSHTPVAIVAPFGDGFFTEPIVAIAAGGSHNLALGDDGTVWAWGSNTFGQLGRESGPGSAPRRPRPVVSPSGDSVLENIVDIAAGAEHSLALPADGIGWAWGLNDAGQLGDGTTDNSSFPVEILDLTDVMAIAAGAHHSLALANLPPVAIAYALDDEGNPFTEIVVECDGHDGTIVTLDGRDSYDPDGDELTYQWSVDVNSGFILEQEAPVTDGVFVTGVHLVTLTVDDRRGGFDVADVKVTVVDTRPPFIAEATTDLAVLWPPHNRMVPVTVVVLASDECTSPEDLRVVCWVSSSQPDGTDALGGDVDGHDGYTEPVKFDLEHVGDGQYEATIQLRARRAGDDRSGRTYSISVEAWDQGDNLSTASCVVVVPHNQSGGW